LELLEDRFIVVFPELLGRVLASDALENYRLILVCYMYI
jgi:hypothetical protein